MNEYTAFPKQSLCTISCGSPSQSCLLNPQCACFQSILTLSKPSLLRQSFQLFTNSPGNLSLLNTPIFLPFLLSLMASIILSKLLLLLSFCQCHREKKGVQFQNQISYVLVLGREYSKLWKEINSISPFPTYFFKEDCNIPKGYTKFLWIYLNA